VDVAAAGRHRRARPCVSLLGSEELIGARNWWAWALLIGAFGKDVRTMQAWIARAGINAGPDSAKCAGHSLRAGHATSARLRASERSIMNQTGHKSVQMVRR
jgi:integrase